MHYFCELNGGALCCSFGKKLPSTGPWPSPLRTTDSVNCVSRLRSPQSRFTRFTLILPFRLVSFISPVLRKEGKCTRGLTPVRLGSMKRKPSSLVPHPPPLFPPPSPEWVKNRKARRPPRPSPRKNTSLSGIFSPPTAVPGEHARPVSRPFSFTAAARSLTPTLPPHSPFLHSLPSLLP